MTAIVILCVRAYERDTLDDGAVQKAHYKHAQKMLTMGYLHEGKVPMQEIGREGNCSKGAHFQELMVPLIYP